MARRTTMKLAAPEPDGGGGGAPEPAAAPAVTAYQTVWVYKKNVALASNQMGFVRVLSTAAATMIGAGQAKAINPLGPSYPYREGTEPTGWPPPAPAVVVTITAFSAGNPTIATASSADVLKLSNGDSLKLTATGGDPAAVAKINGMTGTVANRGAINFDLTGIDLSGENVTGLAGTGTVQP